MAQALRRIAAAGALAAAVAACAADIDKARKIQPTGGDFNSWLAKDYRDLAVYKEDGVRDYDDSKLFAKKALDALAGKAVPPENPNSRNIADPGVRTQLQAAHSRLTSALMAGAAAKAPVAAARAQVSLDCWIDEEETGWMHHIQACRDTFVTSMSRVDEANRPARPPEGSAGVDRVPLEAPVHLE
jgi:hypothetical protein